MIPILSTILIACTPDHSLICEPSVASEQSSLISAKNIPVSTPISSKVVNNVTTQREILTEKADQKVIANENLTNIANETVVATDILTEQDNNSSSQTSIFNQKVSNSSLSAENESVPSIPIAVEIPAQTTADSLGKPIQLQHNNDSQVQWNQTERILITKSRQGDNRLFKFAKDSAKFEIVQETQESDINNNTPASLNVVEVLADQQEYLDQEQIIKARGNVLIRFSNGILVADQVLINLVDRVAVAQNNVNLKRGEQVLKGDRFEYYFVEDKGVIYNAQGEIYQPSLSQDVQFDNNPIQKQPLTSQFEFNQPLTEVESQEGYSFGIGTSKNTAISQQSKSGGQINRYRFQAERVNFDSRGWQAINIRITNDPFSPPEFEVRADTANLRKISDFEDELVTTNSRLVFDQKFSLPLFRNRLVFSRRESRPGLFSIGFDGDDLGGLYIEREFDIYSTDRVLFTLTPQFLIQRALFSDRVFNDVQDDEDDVDSDTGLLEGSSYGLVSKFEVDFSERSNLRAIAHFTGLDLENIDQRLRANVRFNQKIGDLSRPYNFRLAYNYRERLFNGSLGFRTVQGSFGGIVVSPVIPLGDSPFGLIYQGSIQNIRAKTDRDELIGANRNNDFVNLTRFQGAASINGSFVLWRGKALPATAEEGLRYTSTPVVPYLRLNTGLRGVTSYYTNGDTQPSFTARIGLEGQLGHFSRSFLDYTAFSVSFRQAITGSKSPFLFDRFVDNQVLSVGLTQQLYGPLKIGVQTFYDIDDNKEISTDYVLEYSRRTYNVILRYNPVLEIGSLNLRISDFNWEGNSTPFDSGTGVKPVVDGVTIDN